MTAPQVGSGPADASSPPAPPASSSTSAPRRSRRLWLVGGGAIALAAVLLAVFMGRGRDAGPRVLTDTGFVTAANRRCGPAIAALRPPDSTGGKAPTNAQVADRVDEVATGLGRLAGELRAIPAAPADQPPIAAWLDDWDRYTAVGHRFAAAVRARDQNAQARIGAEGDRWQRAADRFARANGLSRCEFFIVPHGSGGDPFSGGM